jgi:hypothetical protein
VKATSSSGRPFPLELAVDSVRNYLVCDDFEEFNLEY